MCFLTLLVISVYSVVLHPLKHLAHVVCFLLDSKSSLYLVCVGCFLLAMMKCPVRSNLREEGLTLAHSSRAEAHCVGEGMETGVEAAVHTVPRQELGEAR